MASFGISISIKVAKLTGVQHNNVSRYSALEKFNVTNSYASSDESYMFKLL